MIDQMPQFYPDDFDIDFNGKDLPWEAVCLIPFVQEHIALEIEERVRQNEAFTQEENKRNTYTFNFLEYIASQNTRGKLVSPLKGLKGLSHNKTVERVNMEYADVGSLSFNSFIHKSWKRDPSYPSFKHMKVTGSFFFPIRQRDTLFQRIVVQVEPNDKLVTDKDVFNHLNKFIKSSVSE